MKATTNAAQAETDHPPLARDPSGNLLPIPSGTVAWRLCRHTGGRPRVVNGPDQEPLRFPLHVTRDELADTCGADTYRVYALDEVGNVLDYVTTVNAGLELRNSAPEAPAFATERVPATSSGSDLRYALDAITHMARTNSEAMRAIAESQADWVKAIALAKGLPRNVVIPPPPRDDRDDEEDEDEPDETDAPALATPPTSGIEAFATAIAPFVPELMQSWSGRKRPENDQQVTATNPMAHLARIQMQLNTQERKLLEALLADPESGDDIAKNFSSRTVDDVVGMIRRETSGVSKATPSPRREISLTDPAVMQRVVAVSRLLEPAERARLMSLGPRLMHLPDAAELMAKLMPLSDEAAVTWIRTNLDDIEKRCAS
jgi:hypothetical protein